MAEPIMMLERRFNLFPAKFSWRGRVYEIEAVNECKTIPRGQGDSPVYHFWVRCGGQSLHLCQESSSDFWMLQSD
jgi:hypothetical protein